MYSGKTVTIRPKDKPWFDSALRNKIRLRNHARNKALRTQNISDMKKFKKLRNEVKNMKKKKKSFCKLLQQYRN